MKIKFNLKDNRKQFSILVFLLCLIFTVVYIVFSGNLSSYLKTQIINEAQLVAKSNSTTILSLDKSINSIHSMLVEQLTNVADIVVTTSSPDNIDRNNVLSQLYLVDELNWFSSEGIVLYSSKDYEGEQFPTDHHVWVTIQNSESNIYLEDVREDMITGEEYLLLYMRAPDNSVVQVGVLTTRIRELTDEFSINTLLNNLSNKRIFATYVYAPYQSVQVSNLYDELAYELTSEQRELLFLQKNFTREATVDGVHILEIYTRLSSDDGTHVGAFFMAYSLEETESFVTKISISTLIFLILITLLIFYFISLVARKNREIELSNFTDTDTSIFNVEYIRHNYDMLVETNATKNTTISVFLISNFRREQLLSSHEEMVKRLLSFIDVMKTYSESKEIYRYSEDVFFLVSHHWEEQRVLDSIHSILDNNTSNFECRTALIEDAAGFDNVDTLFETYRATVLKLREDEDTQDLVMNTDIQERLLKRQSLERDMRLLSTEGFGNQLHVEFQPQIDVSTGKVIGFETLTRWIHPTFGYISPWLIFDIAEATDYYNNLNQWVITQSLEFIKRLNQEGFDEPIVSVNTPNAYVLLPDCIHNVKRLMERYDISPNQLGFEITETTFDGSTDILKQRITEFNQLGITTYIDDYGSGYSSMVRLRDLDVNVLKIDKTFIDDINKDERFLNNILGIAKELNLDVIAEGVEYDYQIEWLKQHDCSVIQGFYFSKSRRIEEAIQYIKQFEYKPTETH